MTEGKASATKGGLRERIAPPARNKAGIVKEEWPSLPYS